MGTGSDPTALYRADLELVRRALQPGPAAEEAWKVIFGRLHPVALALARRFGGFGLWADDAAQEAMLRMLENLGEFEGRARLETFFYRLALNRVFRFLRQVRDKAPVAGREDVERLLSDSSTDPAAIHRRARLQARLAGMMSRLTEEQFMAVTLRYYEGKSTAEIGEVLGRKTPAAKQLLWRGVEALRRVAGRDLHD